MFHLYCLSAIISILSPLPKNAMKQPVVLYANTEELIVSEPLFVKLELWNHTQVSYKLSEQLGARYGTVVFYACAPNEKDFKKIDLMSQDAVRSFGGEISVLPEAHISCFELVANARQTAIFTKAGDWQYYFEIVCDGARLRSATNTIKVVECKRAKVFTDDVVSSINILLFEPSVLALKFLAQLSAVDTTVNDRFSQLVVRAMATHKLVTATSKKEISDALNQIELLRKDMGAIELEHFDYQVASRLFSKKDPQAVKYLKRVDEFNTSYAGLMREAKKFDEK